MNVRLQLELFDNDKGLCDIMIHSSISFSFIIINFWKMNDIFYFLKCGNNLIKSLEIHVFYSHSHR